MVSGTLDWEPTDTEMGLQLKPWLSVLFASVRALRHKAAAVYTP